MASSAACRRGSGLPVPPLRRGPPGRAGRGDDGCSAGTVNPPRRPWPRCAVPRPKRSGATMDEQLVDALRRRSEHDSCIRRRARAGAVKAPPSASLRRERRRACPRCSSSVECSSVAATGSDDSVQVAVPPSDDPPVTAHPTASNSVRSLDPCARGSGGPVDDAAGLRSHPARSPTSPASVGGADDIGGCRRSRGVRRARAGQGSVPARTVAGRRECRRHREEGLPVGHGLGRRHDVSPRLAHRGQRLARQQFHGQMALVADGALVAAPTIQPADAEFVSFGGHLLASVPTGRPPTPSCEPSALADFVGLARQARRVLETEQAFG